MMALIVGGSKSGKSSLAQQLAVELAGDGKRYYLATMLPRDGEDLARIARHLEDRAGMGFETVEQGKNLPGCLSRADRSGTFLLDSVTALLTNEFFPPELDYVPDYAAGQRVGARHFLSRQRPAVCCFWQAGARKSAVGPPTSWI